MNMKNEYLMKNRRNQNIWKQYIIGRSFYKKVERFHTAATYKKHITYDLLLYSASSLI